jgi:hypothetical protein
MANAAPPSPRQSFSISHLITYGYGSGPEPVASGRREKVLIRQTFFIWRPVLLEHRPFETVD